MGYQNRKEFVWSTVDFIDIKIPTWSELEKDDNDENDEKD